MPELPEVETVRRGLSKALKGAAIASVTLNRPNLRLPFTKGMEKRLQGLAFGPIERRSKYLIFHFKDSDEVMLSHLGMTGTYYVRDGEEESPKSEHVVFHLKDGRELAYRDWRRFGLILVMKEDELAGHPLMKELGPEPFSKAFSEAYLAEALKRRKGPIKPALMDAGLVVGLGNIYAAEALFRIQTHPATVASKVGARAEKLITAIHAVLQEAIDSGGSSLRNYTGVFGDEGGFQHFFYVYGREGKPCRVCETPIAAITQAGRTSFFCPQCQPKPRTSRNASKPASRAAKAK